MLKMTNLKLHKLKQLNIINKQTNMDCTGCKNTEIFKTSFSSLFYEDCTKQYLNCIK